MRHQEGRASERETRTRRAARSPRPSAGGGQAARTPFVLLVGAPARRWPDRPPRPNSALSEGSFHLDDLQRRSKSLTDEEQALQRDVAHAPRPTPSSAAPASWAWCPAATRPSSTRTAASRASPERPPSSPPDATRWSVRRAAPPSRRPTAPATSALAAAVPSAGTATRQTPAPQTSTADPDPADPRPHPVRAALLDPRQVTEVSDREPPRRRVPGPARPVRPGGRQLAVRPRRPPRTPPGRAPARRPAGPAAGQPPPPAAHGQPRQTATTAFVVRLLQVQAVDANAYVAKAEQNRYVGRTLAATRGGITDRNGVELATSVDVYDITAYPTMFTQDTTKVTDAPEQAAALLGPILGQDVDIVAKKLRTKNTRYTLLAHRQTPQVWKQIKDLRNTLAVKAETDKSTVNFLAGVVAVPASKARVSERRSAAGILGWVNADGKGGGGVEQKLNKELAGKDGKIRYAQSGGRQVPTAGRRRLPPWRAPTSS